MLCCMRPCCQKCSSGHSVNPGAYIGLLQQLGTILEPGDKWQPAPAAPVPQPRGLKPREQWCGIGSALRWQHSCFEDIKQGQWRSYKKLRPGKYADRVSYSSSCTQTHTTHSLCSTWPVITGPEYAWEHFIDLSLLAASCTRKAMTLPLPRCLSQRLALALQVAMQRTLLLASVCHTQAQQGGSDHNSWAERYKELLIGVRGENICTETGRRHAEKTAQDLECFQNLPLEVTIGPDEMTICIVNSETVKKVMGIASWQQMARAVLVITSSTVPA